MDLLFDDIQPITVQENNELHTSLYIGITIALLFCIKLYIFL